MSVATYETKYYTLPRYAMQLITTDEETIRMFIRVLNSEFEVLYVHTTSAGNNFNAVTNNIKKVEEVRRDC